LATSTSTLAVTETPPSLAVSVTSRGVETEDAVASKLTLVAPAGTVTVAGTVSEELLEERFTVTPPLEAVALSVTEQASVPVSGIEPLAHVKELTGGALINPIPLMATTGSASVPALLVMESWPVAAPDVEGLKVTLKV
jgi:hypothetical protein